MKRVLSGMRPTGQLHFGNYLGALNKWIELQEKYECFFMIADLHALTTDYEDTTQIEKNTIEMLADWIACGIDPKKSTIFKQSAIPQHSELALILGMITPLSWLERNPTYKEQIKELSNRDLYTYGFLGYPVLQAADILLYNADYVPVGEDQLPHLELTREIARRFNFIYKTNIFTQPQNILTKNPKLPGVDARKMSKSYNNCIYLADEDLKEKINQMFTDPNKIHKTDPGNPDGCVVFAFHKFFSENYNEIEAECRKGRLGCVDDKNILFNILDKFTKPIIEKRKKLLLEKKFLYDILIEGNKKAYQVAERMLNKIKKIIKIF